MLRLRILTIAAVAVLSSLPAWADNGGETSATPAAATATATTKVAATESSTQSHTGTQPADTRKSVAEKSPAAPKVAAALPSPTLTVQINLGSQSMTVYEDGVAKYSWAISSGTASHPTPRGTFRPQWTAKMWYSRKYDNAPMPNAVFIHGGVAIHATPYVSRLGSPASHGCIRLAPSHARTFYRLVHQHGLKKVRVSVYGTPKWRAPAVASRKSSQTYAAQQSSGGSSWSWLFGPPQAYNPKVAPKRSAGKSAYYKTKKRHHVPKYYYYSSN
jgi:lipoprotein-anchoring transpeptidase ErfK/SrfK